MDMRLKNFLIEREKLYNSEVCLQMIFFFNFLNFEEWIFC